MSDLTDAELREYLLLEVATTKFYKASHTVGPAAAREVLRLRELLNRYRIEPDRCEKFPKGERCGLKAGHEGKCRWLNGD